MQRMSSYTYCTEVAKWWRIQAYLKQNFVFMIELYSLTRMMLEVISIEIPFQ